MIDIETAWIANEESDQTQPESLDLLRAWPNPFNPTTTVSFTLDQTQDVHVTVHDITGREVALLQSGLAESGEHTLTFDADGLPSGVYLVVLDCQQGRQVQRVTLLR